MKKLNIIQNTEIAPGIYALKFRKFFDFIPGQVVNITVNSSVAPRMYSIASGVSDTDIQLIYDIKPEGELTNILNSLKEGDELMVSLPFGQFTCDSDNAWWIATGTGIAPFYSMMRSGLGNNITLVHGVRRPEFLIYKDEISQIMGNRYFQCCSAGRNEGMFNGRVTDFIKQHNKLPLQARFYLCGNAEMVVDVRDILITKGVDFGNIFSEIYF